MCSINRIKTIQMCTNFISFFFVLDHPIILVFLSNEMSQSFRKHVRCFVNVSQIVTASNTAHPIRKTETLCKLESWEDGPEYIVQNTTNEKNIRTYSYCPKGSQTYENIPAKSECSGCQDVRIIFSLEGRKTGRKSNFPQSLSQHRAIRETTRIDKRSARKVRERMCEANLIPHLNACSGGQFGTVDIGFINRSF